MIAGCFLLCPLALDPAYSRTSTCRRPPPHIHAVSLPFTSSPSNILRAAPEVHGNIPPRYPPSTSVSSTKGGKPTTQHAQWYGADYTAVEVVEDDPADITELIEAWDGCTYVEALGESPNVPGIGEVSQV